MPSAGASRLAGLIEWINGLPAWGHGRYSAAEWQTWADEQQSEGGDRLWHYWTAVRVQGQGPAADTGIVWDGRRRIWLRSE